MRNLRKGPDMTEATMTRDDADSGDRIEDNSENRTALRILLTVLVALAAWGVCIFLWGIPGLYLPALALVPVVWAALIAISMG
jgi:hypothetical protein